MNHFYIIYYSISQTLELTLLLALRYLHIIISDKIIIEITTKKTLYSMV